MDRLDIGLLGDPRFSFDGTPWRFAAPPKCLPLLALLVLRGEPFSRAALATQLWPDDTEADARANLRRHLHALTRALPSIDGGSWIETLGQSVAWNATAPAYVDALEFQRLAAEPETYARAIELYRADLLAASFDEAIIAERERLRAMQLHALYELAQQSRLVRDYARAATYAEAILGIDEWREDALRLLMSCRYAAGDRSGALASFERFARRLRDELRAEPMFETAALRDAIVSDTLAPDAEIAPARVEQPRPLVGREDVMAQLQHAWLRAANGSGSTLFIAGEAGIGKSRLAQELLATIETQGGRAVIGRTSEPEALPYQPLIEALRQIVPYVRPEARDDRWLRTLSPLVPEVGHVFARAGEPEQLEADRGNYRLQDAMLRAIEASARVRPLAILLEDLHFANADTIEMIHSIAERLSGVPAVLLLTYRSTEAAAGSPLRGMRRALQRSSHASHIALPRLQSADVARVVELAQAQATPDLARRVFELSEGNPLFMWQLLHRFAERPDELDVGSAIASVADAIQGRLALLSPEVRQIADAAATIGDTFSVEEIAEVGGWDESSVFGALATLLDRQLVAERAGSSFEYGFTHALVGHAIYDATPESARAIRHRRAAEVLQRTRIPQGRGYALIAQHFERAGDVERAREAYVQGARAALQSYARRDARELAQRAIEREATGLELFAALQIVIASTDKAGDVATAERAVEALERLAETLAPEQRFEALVTRIRFHEHHSQRKMQGEAIDRLASFAREHHNDKWQIEATLRRGALAMQLGGTADGEAILRELGNVERITDPKQRYRYYSQIAQSIIRQGRYDEGQALLRAFRSYLETHPSLEGESLYAYAEHKYAWLLEDALYIKRTATRIIELALARGDTLDEANGRIDLAYVTHQLHDTSAARTEFERALELFARCHSWQGWVNTRINYGVMEREIGHLDRALEYWREGQEKAREIGVRLAVTVADTNFAEVELTRRNYARALEYARKAYQNIAGSGESRLLVETKMMMGLALFGTGATSEGRALVGEAFETSRSLKQPRTLASHLTIFLETMLDLRETGELRDAAAELEALFDADPHDHQHPGRICSALAATARALGETERADSLAIRAREVLEARLDALTEPSDRAAFVRMNEALLSPA